MTDISLGALRDQRSVGRERQNRSFLQKCIVPTYFVASWRGVHFFCDSTVDEVGRRGDVYEYPLSDWIGYKDMGRKARRFKVEGYLIGADQRERAAELRSAADAPNPGTFIHPLFGEIEVACITCTIAADYRKDISRTKVTFEFVEAGPSLAPYQVSATVDSVFDQGNRSVAISLDGGTITFTNPTAGDLAMIDAIKGILATDGMDPVPADDERALDTQEWLKGFEEFDRAIAPYLTPETPAEPQPVALLQARNMATMNPVEARTSTNVQAYTPRRMTFRSVAQPINVGTAEVRRLHLDALERLKEFNHFVVQRSQAPLSDNVQALIVTTRLAIARDFAVAVAQKTYTTIKEALDDLDFVVTLYDEEEEIASQHCDDALVNAIYMARAMAAEVILANNIRLPGIAEYAVDGVWPSLVVAQKLYNDGRRYQQIENYNPAMANFFMGRGIIAPTR